MIDKLRTIDNWVDYRLNKYRKWPSEVYINLTSECNKQCDICTYDHERAKGAHLVTLEDIKKMTWLKHVKFLGLWCGNGESLLNPEFEDILDYVRATWPHLQTQLSTNGILLTHEIGNKITFVNVSLNRANISPALANAIARIKTTKSISFVMTLDNIIEMPAFVALAGRLGATAIIGHCMFHSWAGARPLDVSKSCYNDPEKTNHYLRLAQEAATNWGVKLWSPPLLNLEEDYICRGTPTRLNLPYCSDPFKRLYLTVDEYAQPSAIVCCSGCYFDVRYDIKKMTPEYLHWLWNKGPFVHLRKTVNKPKEGGNILCNWCKTVNRFKPEAGRSYELIKKHVQKGSWTL